MCKMFSTLMRPRLVTLAFSRGGRSAALSSVFSLSHTNDCQVDQTAFLSAQLRCFSVIVLKVLESADTYWPPAFYLKKKKETNHDLDWRKFSGSGNLNHTASSIKPPKSCPKLQSIQKSTLFVCTVHFPSRAGYYYSHSNTLVFPSSYLNSPECHVHQ